MHDRTDPAPSQLEVVACSALAARIRDIAQGLNHAADDLDAAATDKRLSVNIGEIIREGLRNAGAEHMGDVLTVYMVGAEIAAYAEYRAIGWAMPRPSSVLAGTAGADEARDARIPFNALVMGELQRLARKDRGA